MADFASLRRMRFHRPWEWFLRGMLFLYLVWIPLPFASVTDAAWLPLTLPPLLILALLAWRTSNRDSGWTISVAVIWWSLGASLLCLVVVLQIVPLPESVVATLSPESSSIWQRSSAVVNSLDPPLDSGPMRLSVNPEATSRGLIGLVARIALFLAATQLFRRSRPRVVLAMVLTISASFQVVYGIGHWTGPLVEIWGRQNLTFGRMSGTFVNPNHLGNYLALILPLSLYLIAHAWYATRDERSLAQRVERTILRHTVVVLVGGAGVMVGTFGILLTKSRGSLLALLFAGVIGLALYFEESAARKRTTVRALRRRAVWTAIILLVILGASIVHLGAERITRRMIPDREGMMTLAGRIEGARIATAVWGMFPLTGSGFETFRDVSMMVAEPGRLHHSHAHNDWLELFATTGWVGGSIVLIFFLIGLFAMARQFWPRMFGLDVTRIQAGDWRRFASMAAISLMIAMFHALVDFAFYIPANSYTLAVIMGAALAIPHRGVGGRASGPKAGGHRPPARTIPA